ncbi:hypothetical protein Droror1_Dr00024196 [Drosera rotundifolia]
MCELFAVLARRGLFTVLVVLFGVDWELFGVVLVVGLIGFGDWWSFGFWVKLMENFENKYLEPTEGAAENYHRSWWKRHGVALDGEIAAVCHRHGDFDLAAKSHEKVCALYSGQGWQDLLAQVLPSLAECQKMLNDEPGYLQSCVRLLSLDKGLFLLKERQAFQAKVVRLAHGETKHPVGCLAEWSGNSKPQLGKRVDSRSKVSSLFCFIISV